MTSGATGKMTRSSPELAALPISIVDEMAQSDAQAGHRAPDGGIAKRIGDEIPAGVWELLRNVSDAVRACADKNAIPTVLLRRRRRRVPWELALMPDPCLTRRASHTSARSTSSRAGSSMTRCAPFRRPALPITISSQFSATMQRRIGVNQLPFARKEADYIRKRNGTALDATRTSIIDLLTGKANRRRAALAPASCTSPATVKRRAREPQRPSSSSMTARRSPQRSSSMPGAQAAPTRSSSSTRASWRGDIDDGTTRRLRRRVRAR